MGKVHTQLMTDHKNLSRVLKVLGAEIHRLGGDQSGEGPDFMLLEDILDYIRYYPEAFHHPLEEAAFDYLVEHGHCHRKQVEGISLDHNRLEEKTGSLRQKVTSIEAGHPVSFAVLSQELDDYLGAQRKHIVYEEENIFPLIEALGAKEDAEILGRIHHRRDPLVEQHRQQQFERLFEKL